MIFVRYKTNLQTPFRINSVLSTTVAYKYVHVDSGGNSVDGIVTHYRLDVSAFRIPVKARDFVFSTPV